MHATTLTLVLFAATAYAQSISTTDTAVIGVPTDIPDCVRQCIESSATAAGCSSFADLACICTSSTFRDAALQCFQGNCTPEEVIAGQSLQQTRCAGQTSSTGSGSASATGSITASFSSSSTRSASTSSSAPATSSSVKSGAKELGMGGVWAAAVAVGGGAVGALVL